MLLFLSLLVLVSVCLLVCLFCVYLYDSCTPSLLVCLSLFSLLSLPLWLSLCLFFLSLFSLSFLPSYKTESPTVFYRPRRRQLSTVLTRCAGPRPPSRIREQKWMAVIFLQQSVSRDSPSASAGRATSLNGTNFPRACRTFLVMRAAVFLPPSHKHT